MKRHENRRYDTATQHDTTHVRVLCALFYDWQMAAITLRVSAFLCPNLGLEMMSGICRFGVRVRVTIKVRVRVGVRVRVRVKVRAIVMVKVGVYGSRQELGLYFLGTPPTPSPLFFQIGTVFLIHLFYLISDWP